ncbi:ATPase [Escherichia coli]
MHTALKKYFFYVEYHYFIMIYLMSGEHNTLALPLQDKFPGLVPDG